jgi:hypothetical protein
MPATGFSLSTALSSLGVARAFIGDPFTSGGLTALPTEGAISATSPQNLNRLTAPELTGEVAHSALITPGQTTVTVPVIYTGAAQLATLSAHGSASEGYTSPQEPTYTSLVLIPLEEMNTSVDPPTISYDGLAWAPAAPANSLWFWKVVPQRPDLSMAFENGGKVILPVTFEVFYAGSAAPYSNIPAGHKLFTVGDPVAAGVATVRV